ncbi:hypothetical protein D3C86_1532650 [compost metagenome]
MRNVVTSSSGVMPPSWAKRRASVARETLHSAARLSTVHGCSGARTTASTTRVMRASAISAINPRDTPPRWIKARSSTVNSAVDRSATIAAPPGRGRSASACIMPIRPRNQLASPCRLASSVPMHSTSGSVRSSTSAELPSTKVPHRMSSGAAAPGTVTSVTTPLKWRDGATVREPACRPISVWAAPCGNSSTSPAVARRRASPTVISIWPSRIT